MENIYPVKRNKVYAGLVLMTNNFEEWNSIRSILFTIDENGMAHDLLYNSIVYPVSEFVPNEIIRSSKIIVSEATNLEELLLYFNYPDELEYSDIKKIESTMFNKIFLNMYCEHFGIAIRNNSLYINRQETPRISSRYFFLIHNLANTSLKEYLMGEACRINSFKPVLKEKIIRSLKKNH